MPRELVVGNGNLLICLDKDLHIRDFYYPHVGELNHVIGHYHRLGIWVDGRFSWLSYDDWKIELAYKVDTLVTESVAINASLNLKMVVNDTVLPDRDVYIRKLTITSLTPTDKPRDCRVFFCQDYYLYESDIGDTAFHDPHSQSVIHYKRNLYLLSGGVSNGKTPLSEYSCGTKKFHGAEGTWKDAEDGELSQNPIAQGSVDSAMGFRGTLDDSKPWTVDYWIVAGDTLKSVRTLNLEMMKTGADASLEQAESYWRNWVVSQVNVNLSSLPPNLATLFKRSLLTIRTQADNDGAITAANDTDYFSFSRDTYSYMWPRDGAFVAHALDKAGHQHLTRRFFRFCYRIFQEGFELNTDDKAEPLGFFYHKYTPSGAVGSSWHSWITPEQNLVLPIQEDETALILWSLWNHYQQYRDIEFVRHMYEGMVVPAANFLCFYRDPITNLPQPSYDLWEERLGVHSFTVATVFAGLQAAANFATVFGDPDRAIRYREVAQEVKAAALKYLWSEENQRFYSHLTPDAQSGQMIPHATVGSSTYALFYFEMFPADEPKIIANMKAIKDSLWVNTEIGGIARYENDYYHQIVHDTQSVPGNPWIVCTMWLAQWYIALAQTEEDLEPAMALLEWTGQRALSSGLFAEQFNPTTGEAISVAPLTWSHAAYVATTSEYLEKAKKIAKRDRLRHSAERRSLAAIGSSDFNTEGD